MNVPVFAYQDIFWLHIAIENVMRMQILEGQYNLSNNEFCCALIQFAFIDNQLRQVTISAVIKSHVEMFRSLKGIMKPNNKWAVHFLENICLPYGIP